MREQQVILAHFQHVGVNVIHAPNGDRGGLPLGTSLDTYMSKVLTANFVILFLTPKFKENGETVATGAYEELNHIMTRITQSSGDTNFLIPLIQCGTPRTAIPTRLSRLCAFVSKSRDSFVKEALDECLHIVCHRIYKDSSTIKQLLSRPIISLVRPTLQPSVSSKGSNSQSSTGSEPMRRSHTDQFHEGDNEIPPPTVIDTQPYYSLRDEGEGTTVARTQDSAAQTFSLPLELSNSALLPPNCLSANSLQNSRPASASIDLAQTAGVFSVSSAPLEQSPFGMHPHDCIEEDDE